MGFNSRDRFAQKSPHFESGNLNAPIGQIESSRYREEIRQEITLYNPFKKSEAVQERFRTDPTWTSSVPSATQSRLVNVNFNLLFLCLLGLGQADLQDTVLESGFDFVRLHFGR
jgi:hypothetical protein